MEGSRFKKLIKVFVIGLSLLSVTSLLCASVSAQIKPAVGDLRYVADQESAYSINEIREDLSRLSTGHSQLNWINPNSTVISLGFHREPHWFSWNINPDDIASEQQSPLDQYILEVPFPSINHLKVWIFDQNDNLLFSDYVGDSQPFRKRAIPSRKFLFPIEWNRDRQLTVIMSVQTTDTLRFDSKFWPAEIFWALEEQHTLYHGIYMGVIGAMFFLYMSLAVAIRERSFYYYTLWLTFMSLAIVADLGYGFEYLWPESVYWNNRAHAIFIAMGIGMGALFFGEAFSIKRSSTPRLYGFVQKVAAICFTAAIACLLAPEIYVLQITTLSAIPVVALLIQIVVLSLKKLDIQTVLLCLAICIVGTVGTIRILNNYGYFGSIANIEYYLEIATAIEVVLLSIFLAVRVYNDRRKHSDAQQELISLQKTMYSDLEKIVEERTQELESLNTLLAETSVTDPLTGLKNRRYFDEKISELVDIASRTNSSISFMMIDIDHFKQVNDTYGHRIGDECLCHFAEMLKNIIKRDTDLVARYGGEEFIIALSNHDEQAAVIVAEKIRRSLEESPLINGSICVRLSCSVGLASKIPTTRFDADALIEQADSALYSAKANGRNCVETGDRSQRRAS